MDSKLFVSVKIGLLLSLLKRLLDYDGSNPGVQGH